MSEWEDERVSRHSDVGSPIIPLNYKSHEGSLSTTKGVKVRNRIVECCEGFDLAITDYWKL